MADHTNHLAAGVEGIKGIQRNFQGVAIERAETFVEEKRIDRGLVADQIGKGNGQRQTDQKSLAAGERARFTLNYALPAVYVILTWLTFSPK